MTSLARWLALGGIALGCSSPAPAYAPAPTPASDDARSGALPVAKRRLDEETKRIAKMLERVSRSRKLTPKREVPGKTLSRAELLGRVREHVAREVPAEAIRNEAYAMKVLALVPSDFDYEAETFALLEAQLAGYYEPADRTMYMAADLDEGNAVATLAHELVHALQDQYWDLRERSKYRRGNGDLASTVSALAEGDATSAMVDVLLGQTGRSALDLPEEVFSQQILSSVSTGASARAPHAMRASLVAPYVYGTLFVHALRRKGGWAAVDKAWERPPVSTEQILHPEKWEKNEAPVNVGAPAFASLGPGFEVLDTDTLGELGARLTFGEWMDENVARISAESWGGDRASLAGRGDEVALGWKIVYDAVRKPPAERAFGAIVAATEARGTKAAKKSAGFACFERPEVGPLALTFTANALVITAGPAKTRKSGKWSGAGSCSTSEKWAREIAAQK